MYLIKTLLFELFEIYMDAVWTECEAVCVKEKEGES